MRGGAYPCPGCGAPLAPHFRYAKLVTCAHCDSLVFLEDGAARSAGKRSVMADWPTLFTLDNVFEYRGWRFVPVGHLRYDYAHGFWDEWWVLDQARDQGRWVSIDEGDYALEQAVELERGFDCSAVRLGEPVRLADEVWQVTEKGRARCVGVRGELPERVALGAEFDYAHLSGADGRLITLEWDAQRCTATEGEWIDPFEIRGSR